MIALPGESRFVEVNGTNVHYVVAGEGSPLLLFHGLGVSVTTWRDNIAPLSGAFRVYAVDLPGHGDSDKPDIDYTIDTCAGFAAGFIESLNLDSPAVIGNSAGGTVALATALRYPHLVSRLVLVDSAALGREVSILIRLAAVPILGDWLVSSKMLGTRLLLKQTFHDQSFVTQNLIDELYRTRAMPGARKAVLSIIRNAVDVRGVHRHVVLGDELERLKMPLMVVWGAQDQIVPVSHAYLASKSVPHARLQVFDQCGHWPHMERASDFNSTVLQFLSG